MTQEQIDPPHWALETGGKNNPAIKTTLCMPFTQLSPFPPAATAERADLVRGRLSLMENGKGLWAAPLQGDPVEKILVEARHV